MRIRLTDRRSKDYPYPSGRAKYRLTYNGITVLVDSEVNCWSYLLLHSTGSISWALRYEGWKMEPVEKEA